MPREHFNFLFFSSVISIRLLHATVSLKGNKFTSDLLVLCYVTIQLRLLAYSLSDDEPSLHKRLNRLGCRFGCVLGGATNRALEGAPIRSEWAILEAMWPHATIIVATC